MAKSKGKGKFGSMSAFSTNFGGRRFKWRSKGGMSRGGLTYRKGK